MCGSTRAIAVELSTKFSDQKTKNRAPEKLIINMII